MREDWDDLLLLDACRYDAFVHCYGGPGPVERRISRGSSTAQFLQANFGDDDLHDTVYVTANPKYLSRDNPNFPLDLRGTFHATVDVWRDGWDEELGTVPPERVVDAALAARERFPDKRLFVHFMQPHYPFIGPLGREIVSEQAGYETRLRDGRDEGRTVWQQLRDGSLAVDDAWRAYVENLDLVLDVADDLATELRGLTAVTSDHGNLFGERVGLWPFPRYGHPPWTPAPELLTVPWLPIRTGERRSHRADPPIDERGSGSGSSDRVRDRLRDLGYLHA